MGVHGEDVRHHGLGGGEDCGVQTLDDVLAVVGVDKERLVDVTRRRRADSCHHDHELLGDSPHLLEVAHASARRTMATLSAWVMPMHGPSHGRTRTVAPRSTIEPTTPG